MTLTSFRGWLVIPMVLLGLVGACSLAEAGQTRPDASLYAEGAGWTVIAERKVYSVACGAALLDFRKAVDEHPDLLHRRPHLGT